MDARCFEKAIKQQKIRLSQEHQNDGIFDYRRTSNASEPWILEEKNGSIDARKCQSSKRPPRYEAQLSQPIPPSSLPPNREGDGSKSVAESADSIRKPALWVHDKCQERFHEEDDPARSGGGENEEKHDADGAATAINPAKRVIYAQKMITLINIWNLRKLPFNIKFQFRTCSSECCTLVNLWSTKQPWSWTKGQSCSCYY